VDLWDWEILILQKSRKLNYYTPSFLDSFARKKDTKIAVVYDSWFNKDLLGKWKKIATWQISNNVICGDDIVSFYAIDSAEEISLRNHLRAYQLQLPKDVKVVYY